MISASMNAMQAHQARTPSELLLRSCDKRFRGGRGSRASDDQRSRAVGESMFREGRGMEQSEETGDIGRWVGIPEDLELAVAMAAANKRAVRGVRPEVEEKSTVMVMNAGARSVALGLERVSSDGDGKGDGGGDTKQWSISVGSDPRHGGGGGAAAVCTNAGQELCAAEVLCWRQVAGWLYWSRSG
ncbi:hypothetical protein LIA77_08511 [Sarocladium implicatum]|nr:hypothetical protein LIA77_08511 [Sarocladium implicatum]